MSKNLYKITGDYDLGVGYDWSVIASNEEVVEMYLVQALADQGLEEGYLECFSIDLVKPKKQKIIELSDNGEILE